MLLSRPFYNWWMPMTALICWNLFIAIQSLVVRSNWKDVNDSCHETACENLDETPLRFMRFPQIMTVLRSSPELLDAWSWFQLWLNKKVFVCQNAVERWYWNPPQPQSTLKRIAFVSWRVRTVPTQFASIAPKKMAAFSVLFSFLWEVFSWYIYLR